MKFAAQDFLKILVEGGIINPEQSDHFQVDSLTKNQSIDEYLIKNSAVPKEEILKAEAKLLNVGYVDVTRAPVSPQALSLVPESVARNYSILPLNVDEKTNTLRIAMKDPFDFVATEFLTKKTGKKIEAVLGLEEDIKKRIDFLYTQGLSPDVLEALKDVKKPALEVGLLDSKEMVAEAPIAKIVSTILEYAVSGRASDIHIEPEEQSARVRYRIDGILSEKLTLPRSIHDSLVSRIKILSALKIDEKRIPQDGRFNFKIGREEVDLRVSTLPTVHGEKVVMRLLKKTGGIPTLVELGFAGPQLKILEEAISKPYGIILITGPTGSGKTTTLYSILTRLNKPGVNILTLEDPVEYQIAGINQVQINPQAGLTFATGLRSFLRQDPNIILVGEIRDKETTQLAIQAALTGHLVFSTLHTNDASTAIPRLLDLGAEPFLISSVLNASVAQRIVRRICSHCKESYAPPQELLLKIKEALGELYSKLYNNGQSPVLYKGHGCPECGETGYLGRVAIFEVIKITPAINRLIIQRTTAGQIEEAAKGEGLITMKQDGYLKALSGDTTIEEVLRVAEVLS